MIPIRPFYEANYYTLIKNIFREFVDIMLEELLRHFHSRYVFKCILSDWSVRSYFTTNFKNH